MFLKAPQTSLKSLNTNMSTSSSGNTLWGLMVTCVLSATWFYHLPLIDLRLLPQEKAIPGDCSTSPAVPPLPWALTACPALLPSQVHPPVHCAAEQERFPWLLARLHCRPRAFCQQKDTNSCRDHPGYKHPASLGFLWHGGFSLVFTEGQTWC